MAKVVNIHGTSGGSVTEGLPVYKLTGPNGEYGGLFHKATDAAAAAKRTWPNQEQDEERASRGWDIEIVR